jgi:hypothetical protein
MRIRLLLAMCWLVSMMACSSPPKDWAVATGSSEHADSARTSVFKDVRLPTAIGQIERTDNKALAGAWSAVMDTQNRLFALWGVISRAAAAQGAIVSGLDAESLKPIWQTEMPGAKDPGTWNYPGGIGVHANGHIYVAYSTRLAKLDATSGRVLAFTELPGSDQRDSTTYNGFTVLQDGRILVKSHHRKTECTFQGYDALIRCGVQGLPASYLALVDPDTMKLLWQGRAPELIGGRSSSMIHGGKEYVYLAGMDKVHRMLRVKDSLVPDTSWGPVSYRSDPEMPGTAVVGFGKYVVIQNNAIPSKAPLRLSIISHDNANERFDIRPFAGQTATWSFMPSKVSTDWENRRIYTSEAWGGLVALDFDENAGPKIAWQASQRTGSFITLVGSREQRVLIASDIGQAPSNPAGVPLHTSEELVWRNANDGTELARASNLPRSFGLTITPDVKGNVFIATSSEGLVRLRPLPSHSRP